MIVIGVFAALIIGITAGAIIGLGIGVTRTREGRDERCHRDAVALADDLLKTPDALDLRDRARKLVDGHNAATAAKKGT